MCSYILPLFNIFFFARVEIAIDERSVSVMELQRPRRHKRLERVYRIQQERQIEGYVASLSLTDQRARMARDHQFLVRGNHPRRRPTSRFAAPAAARIFSCRPTRIGAIMLAFPPIPTPWRPGDESSLAGAVDAAKL